MGPTLLPTLKMTKSGSGEKHPMLWVSVSKKHAKKDTEGPGRLAVPGGGPGAPGGPMGAHGAPWGPHGAPGPLRFP